MALRELRELLVLTREETPQHYGMRKQHLPKVGLILSFRGNSFQPKRTVFFQNFKT